MTDQIRQAVIEKIAYYLYNERRKDNISGTSEHDSIMAEMELMNYEFFIEKYGYITQIIKEV